MKSWRILLWVAVVAVTLWFLWNVRGVLLPFVLAWLTAVLLEPVIRAMGRAKVPRPLAVLSLSALFFGGLLAFGLFVGPQLGAQANKLRATTQTVVGQLAEESADDNPFVRWNPAVAAKPTGPLGSVDRMLSQYRSTLEQFGLPTTRRSLAATYVDPYRENISQTVQKTVNGVVGFLGGAFSQVILLAFTPLFAIFLMMDMAEFRGRFANWIPPAIRSDVMGFLEDVGDVFQNYLRGITINISLYVVVLGTVLTIFGAPFSIIFAIVAGLFYLIPNIGGLMSVGILFVMTGLSGVTSGPLFGTGSSWTFAMAMAVVFFCITTTWDVLITPRIVGSSVKLHPFVGMFVVFCGGALFGVVGMMVAYPAAGVIKLVLERVLNFTHKPVAAKGGLPSVPLRHQEEG
jgi:predicted PurR-regulated permease PerM